MGVTVLNDGSFESTHQIHSPKTHVLYSGRVSTKGLIKILRSYDISNFLTFFVLF